MVEDLETKKRGPGFPSMPLSDAVSAVVIAGRNGPEHSEDAFATYLGHKTANSGAFRAKLASMRDWGLLARGGRDRVALSPLAQELVLAAPDFTPQQLLAAFESCRIFALLYADSAKGVSTDMSRLRTQVLMRHGVAKDQVDRFVASFVQSAAFVGLAQSDGTSVTLRQRESVFERTLDDPSDMDVTPPSSAGAQVPVMPTLAPDRPAATAAAGTVAVAGPPVALRQQWPIAGGEIEFVIRTPHALPASLYGLVADMAVVAEKMKASLAPTDPEREVPRVPDSDHPVASQN